MKGKLIIIRHSVMYTLAAGLVILWGFGFIIYSAGPSVHLLLLLAALILAFKISADRKTKQETAMNKTEKGENPF